MSGGHDFDFSFPCYFLAVPSETGLGRIHVKKIGGQEAIAIFTDLPLVEDHLASISDPLAGTAPLPIESQEELVEFLKQWSSTHRSIVVDFNHKTGRGMVIPIAPMLEQWGGR